jgi:hypothetical protein
MSSLPCSCWRTPIVLSGALLLGFAASVQADPKPLSKEEQAKVDKAVEKAIAYLKKTQTAKGYWPGQQFWEKNYPVGHSALPAYALLEAGVPGNDPVIERAAKYLRKTILDNDRTYELSLGILFFDRLGNRKDKKLIQTLALRLIAGQHRTGGWSYYCPAPDPLGARDARVNRPDDGKGHTFRIYHCPLLKSEDEEQLMSLLGDLSKRLEAGEKPSAKLIKKLDVARQLQYLSVFQDRRSLWREPPPNPRVQRVAYGTTDNTNTQFAMLALWVAQRHGVPVRPTFDLMVERFLRSQRPDGKWVYDAVDQPSPGRSMICVGLLGLAIGRGLKLSHTGAFSLEDYNLHILKGLAALYQKVGFPTGQMEKPVPHEFVYFLWSLERVGMLYNLSTIGDKDWYRWGVEDFVTNQKEAGDWGAATAKNPGEYGSYGSALNTAFALLFLKRSHPMKDLTPKLPFAGKQLNEGLARLLPSEIPSNRSANPPSRNKEP